MMDLQGRIVAETDKAIQFEILDDICLHLQGKTEWFPKSKIRLPKRRYGIIRIYVQNWIYDSKIVVSEWAR